MVPPQEAKEKNEDLNAEKKDAVACIESAFNLGLKRSWHVSYRRISVESPGKRSKYYQVSR